MNGFKWVELNGIDAWNNFMELLQISWCPVRDTNLDILYQLIDC